MVKCCEHVNWCILLVWIRKTGVGKRRLSQKGITCSSGLASGPLPSPFSHSHIGAQTEGNMPWRLWFPLEHKLHVPRRDSQPQHTLAQALQSPSSPPRIAISPQGKASCKVLFCLSPVTAAIQKPWCFQFSKTETSACNFAKPCQGSRLLFRSTLSDMWTVPRAV